MPKNDFIPTHIPAPDPVDHLRQTQSNILGSYSGNKGDHNAVGSNNTTINVYGLRDTTNSGVGDQGGGFLVGGAASGPYRLIPYSRNSKFAGRKNLLELVKKFSERQGHNRIALHGLGGSGKTQIALEYVYQRASESDCDVFWVQGSGVLKFSEGFRAIAQHVRIPLAGAETDGEGFLQGIRRWLEGPNSGDWILVIDNADNEADFFANNSPISKFIPQSTKGTLLFTTRSRQVASRQDCEMIEVGKMGEDEAEELFLKRYGSWGSLQDEEKKVIAMILGSVHHLPLAVVGSAAYMIETVTSPSVYLNMLQENEERMRKLLSHQFSDIRREVNETESILSTYFMTFGRITQQMPAAADLLRLMAFFDHQSIPEELLSQCGLEGMGDSVDFHGAVGKLLGFSLVTIVKCDSKMFYELHRLVQLSLQVYLPTEEQNQWKAAALKVISRFFPRLQEERRDIGPTYIPHALAVTKDATDPTAEELGFRMGQYFLDMGSYNNAEIQFRRCIALREERNDYDWDGDGHLRFMLLGVVSAHQGKYNESEKTNRRVLVGCEQALGSDHPDTLTCVNNLAIVLRRQGKYDESEKMNGHALERREKVLGPDHPDTLASVNNLALVLRDQGKYNDSEAMNRRALKGYGMVLGLNHPDTLSSVNNLAIVLRRQGKYDESETMNRRALEGYEKVLRPDHPNTLASVNSLAMVLCEQGKYDEADRMNRRALEKRKMVLGPDHPDTLSTANNLAVALLGQGKYSESEAINRDALERRERVLGPDHPDTLASVNGLALVLRDQGKYNDSEAMNRRALKGYEMALGSDHPNTLASVSNLATALLGQGNYDESETMNRRAVKGREKVLGPDHPDTLTSVNNLAAVLAGQGNCGESETVNRHALERREKVLGPHHPNTLTSLNNLAMVLCEQGKYDEAERMNRGALERREKLLGPDHPDTLTTLSNLAATLLGQGKHGESEAMNRDALERHERVLGPDHPNTLASVNNLAAALLGQGKFDESEAMNRHAVERREKVLGPDHPDTITAVNILAMVLMGQGKYDEAETVNRRALERREKVLGPDHPDTITAVTILGMVLLGQRKYDESKTMKQRALEGYAKILGPDHPHTLASANALDTILRRKRKHDELEPN